MAQLMLPTWTCLYQVDRQLHSLHGVDLPRPVALTQLATFVVAGVVAFLALHLAGVAFTAESALFFLGPPALLGYLSTHEIPFMDHRRPLGWTVTQLRHVAEPSILDTLSRRREPSQLRLVAACDAARRVTP